MNLSLFGRLLGAFEGADHVDLVERSVGGEVDDDCERKGQHHGKHVAQRLDLNVKVERRHLQDVRKALGQQAAQRNAQRNNLTNMDFLCEDTFELLPRLEKEGHPYDFIILDPPAFTKARRTVENAMRGYKEINYRAMKLLPRGGYLATASCSHFATEELFIKMLRAAAKDAHRQLRQIEVKQQAPDHPILWGVPETNYLKFFLFQVI